MDRYKRNILLEGFGTEGQKKLLQSKVLVIGAGGLGSPVLYYLAAAGVGTLGVVDYDKVDVTNLQRQILHHTVDIGRYKTESAKEKITALNPDVKVNTYTEKFTKQNASELVTAYDFVIDCCDNYDTKFLINDICVQMKKPYSHGAITAMRGEAMTYIPGCACYRCIFDNPPEAGSVRTSEQIGVLGSVVGMVGSVQATEAIKYLTGDNSLITNRLLIIDGKSMNFFSLKASVKDNCICRQD